MASWWHRNVGLYHWFLLVFNIEKVDFNKIQKTQSLVSDLILCAYSNSCNLHHQLHTKSRAINHISQTLQIYNYVYLILNYSHQNVMLWCIKHEALRIVGPCRKNFICHCNRSWVPAYCRKEHEWKQKGLEGLKPLNAEGS